MKTQHILFLLLFSLQVFLLPKPLPSRRFSLVFEKSSLDSFEGDVDQGMVNYLGRALADASKLKPDVIIFEINTFGGSLDAAFSIVDTILSIKNTKTVALVQKKAISAGSLIALASQELICEGTTIGDCAPIVQGTDGTPTIVGEKIQSPLRAKFRNLAQRNHYPELLSAAMVTPD